MVGTGCSALSFLYPPDREQVSQAYSSHHNSSPLSLPSPMLPKSTFPSRLTTLALFLFPAHFENTLLSSSRSSNASSLSEFLFSFLHLRDDTQRHRIHIRKRITLIFLSSSQAFSFLSLPLPLPFLSRPCFLLHTHHIPKKELPLARRSLSC